MTQGSQRSLVTGGCGFVGRALVDALLARGDAVSVLDHAGDAWRDDMTLIRADLRDAAAVDAAIAGADAVFHSASLVHTKASRESLVRAVNIDGAHNVLAACQRGGVTRLIYVSSASVVYDGHDIRGGDETMPYPDRFPALYAETKAIAERALLAADGAQGVKTVSIRPHVVFGPGDTRLVPAILSRARAGKLKFRVGSDAKRSDFTYVGNVVQALLLADERLQGGAPIGGQAYFITNGEPRSFWDFVGRIVEAVGYARPRFEIPYGVAYAAATVRELFDTLVRGGTLHAEEGLSRFAIRYLCTDHYFSHAKATRDLGYVPETNLDEGIARTVASLARA
ncbi:MAG: NAD-dependent epimerase/dehydratase family protein [Nannocystaceae bacterium]